MRWRLNVGIAILAAVVVEKGAVADVGASLPAVAQLQALAERGNGDAALQLGVIYDTGKGVGQDFAQAIRWYRQAAETGNAFAAFDLAALYDAGHGTPRDPVQAYRWYRSAAEAGLGRAAYAVGMMAEAGDGTKQDAADALKWYRRALNAGIAAAQDRMAALKASSAANPQQAFAVAESLWRRKGLNGEDAVATASLEAAAHGGLPLAQYDLAYAYEHGLGVTVDPRLAHDWYQAAANSDGPPTLKAAAAVNRDRLARRLDEEQPRTADKAGGAAARNQPQVDR